MSQLDVQNGRRQNERRASDKLAANITFANFGRKPMHTEGERVAIAEPAVPVQRHIVLKVYEGGDWVADFDNWTQGPPAAQSIFSFHSGDILQQYTVLNYQTIVSQGTEDHPDELRLYVVKYEF